MNPRRPYKSYVIVCSACPEVESMIMLEVAFIDIAWMNAGTVNFSPRKYFHFTLSCILHGMQSTCIKVEFCGFLSYNLLW